jgi:putative membrane protein
LSNLLPRERYQRALFLFFLLFFSSSCISPPYLEFLLMQHVPTMLGALLLAYLSNRFVIGPCSFSSIIVFLCLHTLGARYLYSYVPYDDWSEQLLGINISEVFGFQRNHYDRVGSKNSANVQTPLEAGFSLIASIQSRYDPGYGG